MSDGISFRVSNFFPPMSVSCQAVESIIKPHSLHFSLFRFATVSNCEHLILCIRIERFVCCHPLTAHCITVEKMAFTRTDSLGRRIQPRETSFGTTKPYAGVEGEQQGPQMTPSNLMSGFSSSLPRQMSGSPNDPCHTSSLRRHQLDHHPLTRVCSRCSHLSRSFDSSSSAASRYRSSYAVRSSQSTNNLSIPSQQLRMKQVSLLPLYCPVLSLFSNLVKANMVHKRNKYLLWGL